MDLDQPPVVTGHTEVTCRDGEPAAVHYGAERVVPGSVQVIDVPEGTTIWLRHFTRP